ncbi:MAG: hypothetical protein JWQ87_5556 [Candidatus Sulfotelmatobacter sp.]|nr:hypothetical protein [Candidatus Sulfotelmatobacter sp.]
MNNPTSHQFVLIGLPGAGKTSFLAALWYMVNQPSADCQLELDTLDGESKYLNEIRDAWLQYKPVPRNRALSEKLVSMLLRNRKTKVPLAVTIPDPSGESFRLQWTSRQFTTQYDEHLREANGGILFVHSDNIAAPLRIDMAEALIESAIAHDPSIVETIDSDGVQSAPKRWDIETSPTQVQLVELLQFILGRDYFRPGFRLAVVISAWDLVDQSVADPSEWVAKHLPLLGQFLDSNTDAFEVSLYGVSAQGGRYASSLFTSGDFKDVETFVKRLIEKSDPLSNWLWDQLDKAAQATLQEGGQSPETFQTVLVRCLNSVLRSAHIFDEARFRGVKLHTETKEELREVLAKKPDLGEETLRLNRQLLEDAFPQNILNTKQFAKEAAELQSKAPERRVLLVGMDVKNRYDITEPLQWLMQ